MGENFDAVEWVGLDEEDGKKLIEKYNKEGKEAGYGQQSSTAKRPHLDKTEASNRETRDSRNNRDTRDHRRNNCKHILFAIAHYELCMVLHYLHVYMKIKTEVVTHHGAVLIWEVGEEKDRKEVDI